MSLTKRQIIDKAFIELVLGGYVFDIQPDELESALGQLEDIMSEWHGASGIEIGYHFHVTPSLDQESGIPSWANRGVILSLAKAIAISLGKPLTPDFLSEAKKSKSAILKKVRKPVVRPFLPTLPVGSGRPYSAVYGPVFFGNSTKDCCDLGV